MPRGRVPARTGRVTTSGSSRSLSLSFLGCRGCCPLAASSRKLQGQHPGPSLGPSGSRPGPLRGWESASPSASASPCGRAERRPERPKPRPRPRPRPRRPDLLTRQRRHLGLGLQTTSMVRPLQSSGSPGPSPKVPRLVLGNRNSGGDVPPLWNPQHRAPPDAPRGIEGYGSARGGSWQKKASRPLSS